MISGEDIRNAIRIKGLKMEDVADKLGISRATLFNRLNEAKPSTDFILQVQQTLGLDLDYPDRGSPIQAPERVINNVKMQYNVVRLKNNRQCDIWVPADLGKEDIKIIEGWLELVSSAM